MEPRGQQNEEQVKTMETSSLEHEELLKRYQSLERNLILRDSNKNEDGSTSLHTSPSTSRVYKMLSSISNFQSSIQTVNIDYTILREMYDFAHLLMRIFLISNRMISILFNAVTLFLLTGRIIYHITMFVLINSVRMSRLDFKQPSVLRDLGLFVVEIIVLGAMLTKIFVPLCLYMMSFILNVIFYYVSSGFSILSSIW